MPLGHFDNHPAYRPLAYIAYKRAKTGQGRESVPNREVEVARGTPWFGGAALESDDRGVNPAGVAYEWFTDDIAWLGLPDSRLDEPSFIAVRDALGADARISPLITDRAEMRSRFAALAEYADIWPRIKNGTTIELGRWPRFDDIDVETLPTIDDTDLAEEPDLTPSTFDDCVTKVTVIYADRLHQFEDALSEPASNPYILKVVGEPREVELQRRWFTDNDISNRYAAEYAATRGRPRVTGSIRVKRERARAKGLHKPGTLFVLNWATRGLSLVMRCSKVDWPADRDPFATLTIENERAIGPRPYIPPGAPKPGNFLVTPVAIQNKRIFELPTGLKTTAALQVAILAQRPSDAVISFRPYVSTDNVTFDPIPGSRTFSGGMHFAAYAKIVTAAYPDSTADLDTATGIQVELFGVDTIVSQTDTQRDDFNLLLIVNNEIMSVGQLTALGAGKYRLYLQRALFGTVKATHDIGDECWFIPRNQLSALEHTSFLNGATRHFKLQPFTATQEVPVAGIASFPYTFVALPPELLAPFALKVVRLYRVETSPGVWAAHVVFTWDYSLEQDVDDFDISWRAGGIEGLIGDWSQTTVAATDIIIYDTQGVATVKRQSLDLVVGTSNLNYEIRVRAIDSGVPSDWSNPPLTRRAVSTTTPDPGKFLQFTTQAQLENYSIADVPADSLVFVTINNATHYRQLQAGAPDTFDWSVLDEPTMRWRQTGGL